MNIHNTLPPEILEIIVEFCSPEKNTLHALSLVSTTCLALARKHLFAHVTFHPPKSNPFNGGPNVFRIANANTRVMIQSEPFVVTDSPCARFLTIIKASEQRRSRLGTIAAFVRHLHIREGSGISCWIARDFSLPLVLHALSNLVSFRLSRLGFIPIIWAGIPSTFRDAITRYVLSQSTLVQVRLCGLVFKSLTQVNSLLGSCRGLRTLEVSHSGVQEEGELGVETGGGVQKATLDTLILGPFTPTLFVRSLVHPSCPVKVDMVRKLRLSIPGDFSEFSRILHASTSLEILELILTNPLDVQKLCTSPPSDQLNLSMLPSLRYFRITFDMLQKVDVLLKWLVTILRTGIDRHFPTCPNMMKNLTVVFLLSVPGLRVENLTDSMFFGEWSNVDAVLCGDRTGGTQTHAYSNLQRVDLEFILKKPVNLKFAPRFLNELVLDSPGLKERGLLTINAVDEGA